MPVLRLMFVDMVVVVVVVMFMFMFMVVDVVGIVIVSVLDPIVGVLMAMRMNVFAFHRIPLPSAS